MDLKETNIDLKFLTRTNLYKTSYSDHITKHSQSSYIDDDDQLRIEFCRIGSNLDNSLDRQWKNIYCEVMTQLKLYFH